MTILKGVPLNNRLPQKTLDSCRDELQRTLAQLQPGSLWHDVIDAHGNCLCRGVGDPEDGISAALHLLDFQDKTVLDLGCNAG